MEEEEEEDWEEGAREEGREGREAWTLTGGCLSVGPDSTALGPRVRFSAVLQGGRVDRSRVGWDRGGKDVREQSMTSAL